MLNPQLRLNLSWCTCCSQWVDKVKDYGSDSLVMYGHCLCWKWPESYCIETLFFKILFRRVILLTYFLSALNNNLKSCLHFTGHPEVIAPNPTNKDHNSGHNRIPAEEKWKGTVRAKSNGQGLARATPITYYRIESGAIFLIAFNFALPKIHINIPWPRNKQKKKKQDRKRKYCEQGALSINQGN